MSTKAIYLWPVMLAVIYLSFFLSRQTPGTASERPTPPSRTMENVAVCYASGRDVYGGVFLSLLSAGGTIRQPYLSYFVKEKRSGRMVEMGRGIIEDRDFTIEGDKLRLLIDTSKRVDLEKPVGQGGILEVLWRNDPTSPGRSKIIVKSLAGRKAENARGSHHGKLPHSPQHKSGGV